MPEREHKEAFERTSLFICSIRGAQRRVFYVNEYDMRSPFSFLMAVINYGFQDTAGTNNAFAQVCCS